MAGTGIGSVSRKRLSQVINASKGGITPDLVIKVLGVKRQEAGRLLSRWNHAGWLQKIKRGFYVYIPVESTQGILAIENPLAIVSSIFSPGYVGGFSAIKHWDLSEQIFETAIFFTTRKIKSRNQVLSGLRIHLKTIKVSKVFGTKTIWFGPVKVLISDPSRTMIDFLDDPTLAGGMSMVREFFENYLESEHKNIPLLLEYANKFGNAAVYKRLGFLLEVMNYGDKNLLDSLKKKISKGYSKFDPALTNKRIVRRWGLIVPLPWVKEHDRKK